MGGCKLRLSALLHAVMGALVRRDPFVPFRNHALTRLLEPGMTGSARVLVVVTATALPTHRDHTVQTLRCGVPRPLLIPSAR